MGIQFYLQPDTGDRAPP